MFLGEHQHTLDSKGRLILPSTFRDKLGDEVVMTVGMDDCLSVHPVEAFERFLAEMRMVKVPTDKQRRIMRAVRGMAVWQSLDRQGRVTIPPKLRGYAHLSKDVAVVGQDAYVELWDGAGWDRYQRDSLADLSSTDQPLELGGLF